MLRLTSNDPRWHEVVRLTPMIRNNSLLAQLDFEGLYAVESEACGRGDQQLVHAVRREKDRRRAEVSEIGHSLGWKGRRRD
ncbi:MAG: hypothetical protein AAGB34_08735 [Planctomycetota bacterium]